MSNQMINGVGIDLIEIDRIEKSISDHRDHFLNRCFTPNERAYCEQYKNNAPRFAGRFAAKEAISKALGCGFGDKLSWHDIEILPDESGKPTVITSKKFIQNFGAIAIKLSISHSTTHATAIAIW